MLLSALQENLIVLLSYDGDRAPIIRGSVAPELYGGHYREVAARIYDYIDKYKKPPGDHLPDLFLDKLESKNQREVTLYTEILENIHSAKDGVNAEYVINNLEVVIRRQSLRSIAVELAKELQRDTEDSLGKAEALIAGAGRATLNLFDPGTQLSDKKRALRFLDREHNCFPTGIPEFDKRGFGPTRKEMWLYIANTKTGKTWGLIQLAKMALLHRLKVLHVTLELSEEQTSQRYMQALFALAKRKEKLPITRFKLDQLGRIEGFEETQVRPTLSLEDPSIRKKLERRVERWSSRGLQNIFIKEFPTGALTLQQLQAYMDNMEQTQRFVPDLLIVDYPDLLKLDADNYRLAIDGAYKGLRGLAVGRNLALAVVSQSHRGAATAKQVGAENVAEAYAKIAHADTVITYSQTQHEKQLGLARLFVAAGRNDFDKFSVVISQQYGIGGFVVDSALLRGNYWNNIPKGDDDD